MVSGTGDLAPRVGKKIEDLIARTGRHSRGHFSGTKLLPAGIEEGNFPLEFLIDNFANRAPISFRKQDLRVPRKAIDVVAYAPRRNDAFLLLERRDAADGEAVAPVEVG